MAVWNLGSINIDVVYSVPHIPAPGETLAATGRATYLGGKGANMSVAIARSGSRVNHIGAIGQDGIWTAERLLEYGVDTQHISIVDGPTSQAIIAVDTNGENAIILAPGASVDIPQTTLQTALSEAQTGDWFITQNETNLQRTGVTLAKKMGLKVGYAAAPFDAARVEAVLEHLDFLILNEIEAQQLTGATGKTPDALGVVDVIVTLGGDGADWYGAGGKQHFDALPVTPIDTTGAGDTFTGYVLGGLDQGMPMAQAIALATKAGALMVTRQGTADVIPDLSEVRDFSG